MAVATTHLGHVGHAVPISDETQPETASDVTALRFLSPADAADVDAITALILPSGDTPGAREAHVVHFIDRALSAFFAAQAAGFRSGLEDFQHAFRAAYPATATFAAANPTEQMTFLQSVEHSAFFESLRLLTIVGTLSSSQYGGNHGGSGWKLIGFEDQHVFSPPFGHYDRDYPGFRVDRNGIEP